MSLCIMIFLFLFFSLPFFQGAYTRPSPAQLLKELRLVRGSSTVPWPSTGNKL